MTNIFNKIQEKVGVDKILHFLCGFVITSLGFPYGLIGTLEYAAIGVIMAMLKELYDDLVYKGGDFYDWLATILGIVVALIYMLLI